MNYYSHFWVANPCQLLVAQVPSPAMGCQPLHCWLHVDCQHRLATVPSLPMGCQPLFGWVHEERRGGASGRSPTIDWTQKPAEHAQGDLGHIYLLCSIATDASPLSLACCSARCPLGHSDCGPAAGSAPTAPMVLCRWVVNHSDVVSFQKKSLNQVPHIVLHGQASTNLTK